MGLGILGAIIGELLHKETDHLIGIGCVSVADNICEGVDDAEALRAAPPHLTPIVSKTVADSTPVGRPVVWVESLNDVSNAVLNVQRYRREERAYVSEEPEVQEEKVLDFNEISGQETAKWWAFICAAGHHNLLLAGPQGQGKSMISKAIQGIMPNLDTATTVEVSELYKIAGIRRPNLDRHPYVSVGGKGIPAAALFGGGSDRLSPGAVSLAHQGILHVDEFLELSSARIESLRTVMEDRVVNVVRTQFKAELPADFMLVATTNRCPCGRLGNPKGGCICSSAQIRRYTGKMSAAISDRIDVILHTDVGDVADLLDGTKNGESSSKLNSWVSQGKAIQSARWGEGNWNGNVASSSITSLPLEPAARQALEDADGLTLRSATKAIRLARTIEDIYHPHHPIRLGAIQAAITAVKREV